MCPVVSETMRAPEAVTREARLATQQPQQRQPDFVQPVHPVLVKPLSEAMIVTAAAPDCTPPFAMIPDRSMSKPSPLPKPESRAQVQVPPTALVRQVPGATSVPTKNVPSPNCEIGDFSGERSWVHVGQPSDKKLLSLGAIVTMAGPRGYSLAMTWPAGPSRCHEQMAIGPERVRYVPGAMSTPTTLVPLPKLATGTELGRIVATGVGTGVGTEVGVAGWVVAAVAEGAAVAVCCPAGVAGTGDGAVGIGAGTRVATRA